MILIGENLNIISQTIGPALRERNPKPIQDLAKAEDEAGIDYIDLNIGPARKGGGGANGMGSKNGAGSNR